MPPTSLTTQILLALAAGEQTRAEILQQMQIDTEGLFPIPERSYYYALPRLVREGLAVAIGERYRLTPAGRRLLRREWSRVGRLRQLLHERAT